MTNTKIEFYWMIPKQPKFIEIANDVTEFFGLVRKLSNHGYSRDIIKTMVANAFWYDQVKNDLSKDIEIWVLSRVNRLIELNPHLGD